jgi:hypothetical protein
MGGQHTESRTTAVFGRVLNGAVANKLKNTRMVSPFCSEDTQRASTAVVIVILERPPQENLEKTGLV